jgi:hypothetical protein
MTPEEKDFPVKVLAVDFDGVVKKQIPWPGCETINGNPVELDRMIWELSEIRDAGWKVVIWSSRCSVEMIKNWLESYQCDHLFDAINHNPWAPENLQSCRKIPAAAYLDDRGIRFEGTWNGISDMVLNKRIWWEK